MSAAGITARDPGWVSMIMPRCARYGFSGSGSLVLFSPDHSQRMLHRGVTDLTVCVTISELPARLFQLLPAATFPKIEDIHA